MSDTETLKTAIAETNKALSLKVKQLESNVKETAGTIKNTVEQGATGLRNITNAVSPSYQIRNHPIAAIGALVGLGLFLGSRRASHKKVREEPKLDQTLNTNKTFTQATVQDEPLENSQLDAKDKTDILTKPSKIKSILEPAAIGLFTIVAGEIVKKYVPKLEDQASSIQSSVALSMTERIVREFT